MTFDRRSRIGGEGKVCRTMKKQSQQIKDLEKQRHPKCKAPWGSGDTGESQCKQEGTEAMSNDSHVARTGDGGGVDRSAARERPPGLAKSKPSKKKMAGKKIPRARA